MVDWLTALISKPYIVHVANMAKTCHEASLTSNLSSTEQGDKKSKLKTFLLGENVSNSKKAKLKKNILP